MKLVGLVILGIISGFAITYGGVYLIAWILSLFPGTHGTVISGSGEGGVGLMIGFLVVFPIAFFLGGIVTGYFSYYEIEEKSSLLLMAPALYVNLILMFVAGIGFFLNWFMGSNSRDPYLTRTILIAIGMGLLWYVTSAGGVFLGYFLRERFAKWWYRD
jgi:hypothetical protein